MPTLKDLTHELLEIQDKKNYYELCHFIQHLKTVSGESFEVTSIENITSIIISKGLFYNTEEQIYYNTLRHQLLRWIFERIEADSPEVDTEKRKALIRFFEQINPSHGATPSEDLSLVISFNYDLLLERLMGSSTGPNWMFDYIINLNSYLGPRPSSTQEDRHVFEYLKLHGSLNWFAAPGADRNDLSNVFLVDEHDPSKHLIHHRDIPVYIPMAFAKTEFFIGSLYNILWNIGRRCLEETDEIVFIGYGFPQTDIDNLYFFLNFKSKISDIVILERENSPKINRLQKLFSDSRIINQDAFAYICENCL